MSLKIRRGSSHVSAVDFDWLVQNLPAADSVELALDMDKAVLRVKADTLRMVELENMPAGSAVLKGGGSSSEPRIVLWKEDNDDAVEIAGGFAVVLNFFNGDSLLASVDANVRSTSLWNGVMASEREAFEPVLLMLREPGSDPAYVGPDIPLVPHYIQLLTKLPDPKSRPVYRGSLTSRRVSYSLAMLGRPACKKDYSLNELKSIGNEGSLDSGFDFYLWPNRMDKTWRFYSLRFGIPGAAAWVDSAWQIYTLPANMLPDERTPESLFESLTRHSPALSGTGKDRDDTFVHRKTVENGIPDIFVVQASEEFAGARGMWRICPTIDTTVSVNKTAQLCFDFGTSNSCLAVASNHDGKAVSVEIALPAGGQAPSRGAVLAPLAATGPKELGTVPRHHDGLPWVIGVDQEPVSMSNAVPIPTTEIPSAVVLINDGFGRADERQIPFETVAPKDTGIQITSAKKLRNNLKWSNDPFDGELVTLYVAAILLRTLSSPACNAKSVTISFTYPLSMPDSAKATREKQLAKALQSVEKWTGVTLTRLDEGGELQNINESVAAAEAGGNWSGKSAVPTRLVIDIGGGSVDFAIAVSADDRVIIPGADSIHFGANLILRKLASLKLGLVKGKDEAERIAELQHQIRRKGLAGIMSTQNLDAFVHKAIEAVFRAYFGTIGEYGARMLAATMMPGMLAEVLPVETQAALKSGDKFATVQLVCLGNGWRYLECLSPGKQREIKAFLETTILNRTKELARLSEMAGANNQWISSVTKVEQTGLAKGTAPKDVIARTGLNLALNEPHRFSDPSQYGIRSVNGVSEERRRGSSLVPFSWYEPVGNFPGGTLAPGYQIDLVDEGQVELPADLLAYWKSAEPKGKFSTLGELHSEHRSEVDEYFDEMCSVSLVSRVRPFPALNALFARGLAKRLDDNWGK